MCAGSAWRLSCARQEMRAELQRAIEAGQITPCYHPIINLKTGLVAKFEVLARWIHPTQGVLLPDQFIPIADEMGLSGQISMSLLRQVAHDSQDWPSSCRFAINVSPGQVRELIWLLNTQPGAWQRRLDLSRLEVEMSEEALIRDQGLARELIDVLHEHGARAVLDNFGTGASNFFHLHDTPFDSIKVGKIFVQTMGIDPRAEACVLSMLWLGLGLGIDIVADGVETKEVADQLAGLGCHFAQGYLYARPMGAAEASKMVGVREAA
jgi:EAL domain-containing protein (putative c-di-GMP-specific phosphodiesterase class I)